MSGLYADDYGLDELYSWFDQRGGQQQAPQRTTLLDYIKGEMYANPVRNSLPRPGGNAGANAAMQPVPQANPKQVDDGGRTAWWLADPSSPEYKAGKALEDGYNKQNSPTSAAPVASPVTGVHDFNGPAQDIQNLASYASQYGGVIGSDGNIQMSDAAYAQLMADPRLTVSSQVASPAAAKPKPSSSGINLGSTGKPATSTKPATTTAKPATSVGFNMTTQKPVSSGTKPKNQSTGIKF